MNEPVINHSFIEYVEFRPRESEKKKEKERNWFGDSRKKKRIFMTLI